MSIWPLSLVVCLELFPSDRVKLPSVDHGPFDSRIDCMYLYFTGRKKEICSLSPQGLVAYQRPSRLLEREYVTLSSVKTDEKNVVSGC